MVERPIFSKLGGTMKIRDIIAVSSSIQRVEIRRETMLGPITYSGMAKYCPVSIFDRRVIQLISGDNKIIVLYTE